MTTTALRTPGQAEGEGGHEGRLPQAGAGAGGGGGGGLGGPPSSAPRRATMTTRTRSCVRWTWGRRTRATPRGGTRQVRRP
jgi:hypothetical protein